MSDSQSLLSVIRNYEADALKQGELSQERIAALDGYLGKPYGNEIEGRSQVVMRDIFETVEWILPSLVRIFTSGDEVVQFSPNGPEDEGAAQQESDYINWIVRSKNSWFRTFYVWAKDALIQKNGYVKAWWDQRRDATIESYDGLSDEQFAMLAQDPEVEVVAHQAYPGPMGVAHACKLRRTATYGCVKFEEVAPERVLVSNKTPSVDIETADFVEHWEWETISDLRERGFEVPETVGDDSDGNWGEETARDLYGEQTQWADEGNSGILRKVKVRECWLKYDSDGDGRAELRHCIIVGTTILLDEEADCIPVAALTPNMMPHRHIGMSVADAVSDLQAIRTVLMRGFIDNVYLANHGRYAIDRNMVELDDMLTSRPGGVVRVNGSPGMAIAPLVHQANFAPVLQGMEYLETVRENRSGTTRYNQGLDANSLNKTASGITQIMSAAQARIELIARIFAETGVKGLFRIIHALTLKHATQGEVVRLRGQWVNVDPREWRKRADLSISVGLGTGNKEQQLMHLRAIAEAQLLAVKSGGMGLLVTPKNLYNVQAKIAQNAGFKNPDEFWTDPGEQMPASQPDPQVVAEAAAEQERVQIEKGKLQLDAARFQHEREKDTAEFALEAHTSRAKMMAEAPMPVPQPELAENESASAILVLAQQMERAITSFAAGQERILQAIQMTAQLAGAERRAVLGRGPNGEPIAVSQIVQ